MEELCLNEGLVPYVLPSPFTACPTFRGDHGKQLENTVRSLYDRGLGARLIHQTRSLPCSPGCEYISGWDFTPEDYDVLIGHHTIAYSPELVRGRVVVVDEFPGDAFLTSLPSPASSITKFLRRRAGLGIHDYDQLLKIRSTTEAPVVAEALANQGSPSAPDIEGTLSSRDLHAVIPLAVLGLLACHDLGNGYESSGSEIERTIGGTSYRFHRAESDGGPNPWTVADVDYLRHRVVRKPGLSSSDDRVFVLNSPDLSMARAFIGLDATPTPALWELLYGRPLEHTRLLTDAELAAYVRDTLNIRVCRFLHGRRPYGSGYNVRPNTDAGITLLTGVTEHERPLLISTKSGIETIAKESPETIQTDARQSLNFARVKSRNSFSDWRTVVVHGSPHPGDEVIKLWAALMGERTDAVREGGTPLNYTGVGQDIYYHFVHNQVGQAALRVGRDGKGATVVLNTEAVPTWLVHPDDTEERLDQSHPFASEKGRTIVRHLMTSAEDCSTTTIAGIVSETGVSESTVRRLLIKLEELGLVTVHRGVGFRGANEYEWVV